MTPQDRARRYAQLQEGRLPGELGLVWEELETGAAKGRFEVAHRHMAPNGFVHAAAVIALADTACGYGAMASLPEAATSFTTIELKSNFLASAKIGEAVACEARLVHGGRQTQVWDAEVVNQTTGKTMALFRCTQMVIYPR